MTIVSALLDVVTQAGYPGNCHSGGAAASDYTDSLERPTTLKKAAKQYNSYLMQNMLRHVYKAYTLSYIYTYTNTFVMEHKKAC